MKRMMRIWTKKEEEDLMMRIVNGESEVSNLSPYMYQLNVSNELLNVEK